MACQWALECLLAPHARVVERPDDRVRNAVCLRVRFSVQPANAWLDGSGLDPVAGGRGRMGGETSSDNAGETGSTLRMTVNTVAQTLSATSRRRSGQRLEAGFEGSDHTVTALVFSVIQALIGCTQNGLDGVAIATGLRYADAHCDHG